MMADDKVVAGRAFSPCELALARFVRHFPVSRRPGVIRLFLMARATSTSSTLVRSQALFPGSFTSSITSAITTHQPGTLQI
ncbi:hypothetical protein EPA93_10965 [Ktedonosporobacter rubrisoli]|uniref:Uncharacterized protein n=1 Tax=Ktedonosporobacter rubrisoli TaxID=2509675 RepID=A0A4V0YYK1_KTERU|nr:hypothetical protein [Ktedonosporobacter rubrisoli]QBD76501.1 hypothetical protein EPA93_10965 [Ktedonosporobacter rubrisoli]